MNKKVAVGLLPLVMLMTGAVDGISNIPSIAFFGPQLIFFFICASVFFLLPVGLISAELCLQYRDASGVFSWITTAFGSKMGLLATWLQWINTMFWFPTTLATLSGTLAYILFPELSHNPAYLVCTSLGVFWLMTIINLKDIHQSSIIASCCSTLGMLLPMLLIIVLSFLWLYQGKPQAVALNISTILPDMHSFKTWGSLTAVITACLGMELATVHAATVVNAEKLFPRALLLSVLLTIFTMGLGSLGVALVVPHKDVVLVTGTVQAFKQLFAGFGMAGFERVFGAMLLIGLLGAMVNWLISPAKGLSRAGQSGYLPKKLTKENAAGVPVGVMLLQAVVVSIIASIFFLFPSVNGSYWFLLDMSTELYVIMYMIMFIAAFKIILAAEKIHLIPGGKLGALAVCILGMIGCIITLIVGFYPPSHIDAGGNFYFLVLFSSCLLLAMTPVLLMIYYKKGNHIFTSFCSEK